MRSCVTKLDAGDLDTKTGFLNLYLACPARVAGMARFGYSTWNLNNAYFWEWQQIEGTRSQLFLEANWQILSQDFETTSCIGNNWWRMLKWKKAIIQVARFRICFSWCGKINTLKCSGLTSLCWVLGANGIKSFYVVFRRQESYGNRKYVIWDSAYDDVGAQHPWYGGCLWGKK